MTTQRIQIQKINLGKATAENEYTELPNYFISTQAYRNAKDDVKKKLIYIGNRGAGKSALFNQIAYELGESRSIIIKISPSEYSYDVFRQMNHDFFDIKAAYSIAWHYMLLIHIFKEVVNFFDSRKNIKTNRENIAIITKYLEKNSFKEPGSGLGIFVNFLSKIAKAKLKIKWGELQVGGELPPNELTDILEMKEIKQPLNALDTILVSYPVYIFIDELDTGWNNTPEAKNYISGLLYGATKVNNIQSIKVFLSLRKDMYNNLSSIFKDTEKIRDEIEFLKWEKRQLESLICNRIKDNREVKDMYANASYVSNIEILNLIFEEGVFDLILKNTLQRPRELIYYCNKAIEAYTEAYHSRGLYNKKIDMETIEGIKDQISIERLSDFCREYEDEFPHLDNLIWFFEGRESSYSLDEFSSLITEAIIELDDEHSDLEWIKPFWDNPMKLIAKLFEIGFIRLSINNDDSFASYEKPSPRNYSIVNKIEINYPFRSALRCD